MAFIPKAKAKEPRLSKDMTKMIDNTYKGSDVPYDDIARTKYIIANALCSDGDILRTLHNTDLESQVTTLFLPDYLDDKEKDKTHNGECYKDINIFNYLRIPDIQDVVKTYICFEVDDMEVPQMNQNLMIRNITFRTVAYQDECPTDYGINRADLLGAIIKDRFDWSNLFGIHMTKIVDQGNLLESGFYYRELVYKLELPNDMYSMNTNTKGADI